MQIGHNSYGYTRRDHRHDNYSDPSQPNYRPEWWRGSAAHWERTLDWCGFLEDPYFKDCYLCNVPGELSDDRAARIDADSPEPFFKDAVNDHASIFSQFELAEDAPESLVENQDNVDLKGSDLWQWTAHVLKAAFRDGGALMGADMPPAGSEQALRSERRPRLLWVPLRDVYWPEYRVYDGVEQLAKVSIRRGTTAQQSDGGLKQVNQYWAYELDEQRRCTVTIWTEDDGKFIQSESTLLTAANGVPLNQLPFTDKLTFLGDLNLSQERLLMSPFADILNLNIEHYNARSEYNAVKRKTALPTPVRYWAGGVPETIPPFYPGSGRTQDYDADSRVEYLELKGQSLPELRSAISDLQAKIAARDNKLFSTAGGRSATEADIENQKAKVGYPGVKRLIESAMQDLFTVWELFANPTPETVGGIKISESAIQSPPNPQELAPLFLAVQKSGLSIEAVVRKLVRDGHFERDDFAGTLYEAVLNGNALSIPTLPVDPNEVIQ
ncbi:MAG: DUF4055 domain-containing protein [Cyanobacteria bacterium J06554_11]